METKTYIICDKCGGPIYRETDGVVIQGNIYAARLNSDGKPEGGLVGNNFPNTLNESKFSINEVRMVAYHHDCLRELLQPVKTRDPYEGSLHK